MVDKWDKKCPRACELSSYELADFLRQAPYLVRDMTKWELDFCSSILKQLHYRVPSVNQQAVLDRGILLKLWDNDPRLWD